MFARMFISTECAGGLLAKTIPTDERSVCSVPFGRVVDLEEQPRAGGHPPGHVGRVHGGHVARRPADEGGRRAVRVVRLASAGRQDVDEDVMDHLAVARTALGRLHPDVLLEAGVHDEPLIVQHAGGRHLELLGHREDLVRLADLPALDELQRGRQILVVALASTGVDPRQERVALVLGQAAVVGELAIARIGVPGRHPLLEHRLADPAGPLLGVFIGQQRETARSRPADGIPGSASG